MSSTPNGLELQYLDHIPVELRPKPLYGNIVDVSRSTGKCTIVTWPTSARQRQRQKVKTYTFMLSELPKTQASAMLQRALMTWVEQVVSSGVGVPKIGKSKHKRSVSLPHTRPTNLHEGEAATKVVSEMSTKEQEKLLTGPRVTFFDEEDMLMPPPLPPKDDKYSGLDSPSRMTPSSSPVKRKHHHHHRQGRRSTDQTHIGTAVDIGLVWWESDMHGKRV